MTEKARTGREHREAACRNSSRRPTPSTHHSADYNRTCANPPRARAEGGSSVPNAITGRPEDKGTAGRFPKVTWSRESKDATNPPNWAAQHSYSISPHRKKQAEASLYLQHLACKPSPPASPDDGWGVAPTLLVPATCRAPP